ncbi:membrane protein insertion efficiency factor YidD [Helicobacter cetorum]|uniref:membrane protein insertion efficiency factor YidD n=1 Tax=Helicobacter cetorum TaxID=138563 RepID=UPI000CF148D0|nr:membrane protein insertion efficiency factor YidD [Helicobacter cetorum]
MQNHRMSSLNTLLSLTIKGYQRLFSILKPPTCRFYPTCSHYALWLLRFENPFLAIGKILLRIFSCHPFCSGGIAYPIVSYWRHPSLLQSSSAHNKTISFWLIPTKNSHTAYYIIKV